MKYYLILIGICVACLARGQENYNVVGFVTDSLDQVLIGATTVVASKTDSALITFGITNGEGGFYLPNVPAGEHSLQITYVGYGSFQKTITTPSEGGLLDVGLIRLANDNVLLEEIVVQARHIPVVINGDTIEYNAAAFKVRPGDAIEDLLKKLPGVEVLPSGDVMVQGETVTQIMVDGKEFFGDDPKMATRNLPADIVDKIAVYDDESDEAKFSGIDDGQEIKTINIKLKEDKKNGAFGKLTGGYGNENRYMGKANVNRFSPNMQATWIANLNNVNDLNFSAFDQGAMSGFGGAIINISGRSGNGPGITGDNRAISSGANFNLDLSSKFKLRSSYYYKNTKNLLVERVRSENLGLGLGATGVGNYLRTSENESQLKNSGHNFTASIEYDIDSSSELRIRNRLTIDNNRDNIGSLLYNYNADDGQLLSNANQLNDANNDFANMKGSINYRKRYRKPGRTLRGELLYDFDQSGENWSVNNTLKEMDITTALMQLQLSDQKEISLTTSIYYTEPLSKKYFLNVGAGWTYNHGQFDKNFIDHVDNAEVENDALSGILNVILTALEEVLLLDTLGKTMDLIWDFLINLWYFKIFLGR